MLVVWDNFRTNIKFGKGVKGLTYTNERPKAIAIKLNKDIILT